MAEAESTNLDSLDDVVVAEHALAPHGEPCPSCGCPVEQADKFCPACGTARVGTAAVAETADPTQKHFRCSNCGSEMTADADQRSYVCPFCDSTYVAEFDPEATQRQRPEFVIGFAVTREQAQEMFRQWIRNNSWFRPGDLVTQAVADKQKGVYLPFWSFSMLAQSSWSATIGEYWYRTETYTTTENGKTVTKTRQVQETEWWPLSGRHHHYYSGYLVSGSRGLPQGQALRIHPFNLPALKRYEPYFLAGWLCEEYSIQRDEALEMSRQEFFRREQQSVAAFLPGNTSRGLQVDTQFSRISSDLCLLPVYILSYRYRNKLYRFLVNGQTGKVDGDKPWSWIRIFVGVGCVMGLIAVVALLVALFNR
jgi:transposase-like protein